MSFRARSESDIRFESNIVWLKDISKIPYVREHFETSARKRKGKLKYQDYEVIGYAELETDAPNNGYPGCFSRRVFWLKEYDSFNDPEGDYKGHCPSEGVDPSTIAPKVLGERPKQVSCER